MANNKLINEIPGLAITGARLLMAEHMARRVKDDKPIHAQMAAFVIADILDGVILRKFDADTPTRRVADGVVDHLSVARVGYEIANKNPDSQPYLAILAARAALVGGLNLFHLLKTGEVTKGQNNQKATNLATAAFAILAAEDKPALTHISGGIASGVALSTAPQHLQGIGEYHKEGIRRL